jgi:hypothetical protein
MTQMRPHGRRLRRAVFALRRTIGLLLVTSGLVAASAVDASAAEIVVWNNFPHGIYKANADGSNPTDIGLPITSDSAFPDCKPPGVSYCVVYFPKLSPDGTRITFSTLSGDLYTSDLEGGSLNHVITSQKRYCGGQYPICAAERFLRADWSPDGQTLVIERYGPYANTTWGSAIYTMKPDGSDLREIVNWAAGQREPAFSPDGQRIVFSSSHDPDGKVLPRRALYTTALDGSDARRITSQTDVDFENPAWNGSTIAFNDIPPYPYQRGSNIIAAEADGSGQRALTPSSGTWNGVPDFSSDGRKLVYVAETTPGYGQLEVMNRDGTGRRVIVPGIAAGYQSVGASMGYGAYVGGDGGNSDAETQAALENYTPLLRYDDEEAFRADSAANITDWSENVLLRQNGEDVDDAGEGPDLGIDFLGAQYSDGVSAAEGDRVDARGPSLQLVIAAQTMHRNAAYADRVYGRAVVGSDGRKWLQYWLWYYANPGVSGSLGFGSHEGDWELVQFRLKEDGSEPDLAAYAAHKTKTICSWNSVEKDPGTGAPVVYVAVNSHASYFERGQKHLPLTARDKVEGDGDSVRPEVTLLRDQSWLTWPGPWGGTEGRAGLDHIGVDQDSPRGPAFQGDKWTDPSTWAVSGADGCAADSGGAQSQDATPPVPSFSSQQTGDSVEVDYQIPTPDGGDPVADVVAVTVDRPGDAQTPIVSFAPTDGSGSVSLPVPPGQGEVTVRVSSYSNDGVKSRDVAAPLGQRSR